MCSYINFESLILKKEMMRLLVGTSPKIKATPSGVVSKGFLMPSFLGGLRLLEGQDLFIGFPSPPPLTQKSV